MPAIPLDNSPYLLHDVAPLINRWPRGIQRCFYLYQVPPHVQRGRHRHHQCHMALTCSTGSVKVYVQTPEEERIFVLDKPNLWLVLPPHAWRMMYDFSPEAVLMVLASEPFKAADYIDEPYRTPSFQ